jgi:hypothetical protein
MARKSVEFHEEAAREFLAAFEWYFEITGAIRGTGRALA